MRKKKTTTNDTPLFDEVAYNRILDSINEQLAKLQSLQTEIMAERARQRGEFEAMNRLLEVDGKKILRSIKTPKLPTPKTKKRTTKSSGA